MVAYPCVHQTVARTRIKTDDVRTIGAKNRNVGYAANIGNDPIRFRRPEQPLVKWRYEGSSLATGSDVRLAKITDSRNSITAGNDPGVSNLQ